MNCLIFQSNFTSKQKKNICSWSTVRKCLNFLRTIYWKPNFILLALGQNPEHHAWRQGLHHWTTPQLTLVLDRQSWQRIHSQIQLSKPCCQNELTENNSRRSNVKKNRAWGLHKARCATISPSTYPLQLKAFGIQLLGHEVLARIELNAKFSERWQVT